MKSNTLKDTIGCTTVLLTMLLSTLSGLVVIFADPATTTVAALATLA